MNSKLSNLRKIIVSESIWIAITIILFINYIMYVFFNDGNLYWNITGTICAAVTGGLSIVSIMKNNIINKHVCRYIGCGCFFAFILTFVRILLVELYSLDDSNIVISIRYSMMFYDYIVIWYSFYAQRNNMKKKKVFFNFFIFMILDLVFSICIIKNEYIKMLLIIAMVIISWFKFTRSDIRDIICKEEEAKFVFSFVSGILYHMFFIISELSGVNFVIVYGTIRCISYVNIYVMIENVILNKSYAKVKEDLKNIERTQVNINKVLMDRNKSLTDVELLIKKSEDRYKNLITSIKDGIIITVDNKIVFMNDFIIKILKEKSASDEEGFIKIKNELSRVSKTVSEKGKVINLGKQKINDITVEVYFVKINDTEEIIYIKDVTEMIKVYDIRKKYSEYVKMEESKNEFYANISHELRTPITLIYSALQLNDIYIKNENMQGIQKNNKAIRQNCLRLIRTITNFIDANKITEGYLTLNLKVHNIVSLVENISIACNKYIKLINDNLIFDSEEEEIYVKCDKEIMERVVMNILSNIVKYGEPNGNIYINVEIKDRNVIIIVRVDNYTIIEEYKKHMFDKFTKLNKEFTRKKEGSGLGLFLVKEFLELNGGCINVETKEDFGTSFIMTMPIYYGDELPEDEDVFEIKSLKDVIDTEFSDIYI